MKIRFILFGLCAMLSVGASAQTLGFSLKNPSQQLIDEALVGAFVKVTQSYELCDTVANQHFGRDGKDYYSKVPFLGVKTECGLLTSPEVERPWDCDEDFNEYKGKYEPLLTETAFIELNAASDSTTVTAQPLVVDEKITEKMALVTDSTHFSAGLTADTASGRKKGWYIFLLSDNFAAADSVRFSTLSEPVDVPADGKPTDIDLPDFSEKLCGGIYVTPVQTAIGQVSLKLTGYMVLEDGTWRLAFPFIKKEQEKRQLTPIANADDDAESSTESSVEYIPPTNRKRR